MTILERKAFISSNPRIVLSSCPPPCGHFSIQESATGGLSYKVKKLLFTGNVPRGVFYKQSSQKTRKPRREIMGLHDFYASQRGLL